MTLVDTNVLLDVLTADVRWAGWSVHQLNAAQLRGPLFINDVIYAEISVRFAAIENVDELVHDMRLHRRPIPDAALFLAGKVFLDYRRQNGTRTGVLPDFFIGAQASVERLPLLTRDTARYRRHFPAAALIAP